jgi:elongator complex protein 3
MKISVRKNKKQAIEKIMHSRAVDAAGFMVAKRKIAKKYKTGIIANSEILSAYHILKKKKKIAANPKLEKILRKRAVRTLSGIAAVAVLTKPYSCPGQCAYCPTEKNVPKSYLSNEPAVMRAIRCDYDPYRQVQSRLAALEANGHKPTKIELIVIGGTWSALTNKYKYWYILQCFKAANEYGDKISNFEFRISNKIKNSKFNQNSKLKIQNLASKLVREQRINEKIKYRIIGITVETRPDYINENELLEMRELGVTRVELGVQAVDDKILKLNRRGHGVREITAATKLLKDFGFKVTYHIMPGLPGATPAKDAAMFKRLFTDERFQPDQIKFYPTVVTKGSLLYKWWKSGKYLPYTAKQLEKLIIACKKIVPPYVRIIRLIRDIPEESIVAGNKITNLRQILQNRGVVCRCIRCREAGVKKLEVRSKKLEMIKYAASGGDEYFLQYTDRPGKILYGFCRLRLLSRNAHRASRIAHRDFSESLCKTALIRELHVYGELVSVGGKRKVQHAGLGKKLMAEAEKIARKHGYQKMAVIAGIGVRDYYRKLGYKLNRTYMIKEL